MFFERRMIVWLGATLLVPPILVALPLTAVIFRESARLADAVTQWNKQCGSKHFYDETCSKKRYELSGELAKFVALVNEELDALRDVNPNAPPEFIKESNGRRQVMQLEVRNALYVIKCLGMPPNDSQCTTEAAAIEKDKEALQGQYKETHAIFDQPWISLSGKAEVAPSPKKQ
jgi:hypothetical protein